MNQWEWQALEDRVPVISLPLDGGEIKRGCRVRLRPHQGGDVFDVALTGMIATVEAIEQDYEGKHHVAVVVDQDPGRDLGMRRQPGHRFFFAPDEMEPIAGDERGRATQVPQPGILIAGIGNIFLGDDAFGVEVAQRLAERKLPANVRVADFGIRGFDLAYALLDGHEATILVDACPRGGQPGTVYVIEPEINVQETNSTPAPQSAGTPLDGHSMNPLHVIRLARTMGGELKRILLVGCEPESLGGEEGRMGLSETVAASVDSAVNVIEQLITRISERQWPVESCAR